MTFLTGLIDHWPIDWILIGAFAVFVALDAFRSGGTRAAALVFALPSTLLVLDALPHALFVGNLSSQFSSPLLQAALFGIVFVPLYILTYRIIGMYSVSSGAIVQALIIGVAAAAITTTIWLQIPALTALWHFGPHVQTIFGASYRFWWFVVGYLALAFARS